jgi:hypothetical protein
MEREDQERRRVETWLVSLRMMPVVVAFVVTDFSFPPKLIHFNLY